MIQVEDQFDITLEMLIYYSKKSVMFLAPSWSWIDSVTIAIKLLSLHGRSDEESYFLP